MIEWLLLAKSIAEMIGISVGVIQAGNEIVKLINAKQHDADSFVCVAQEAEFSKRLQIGRTSNPDHWMSKLSKTVPGTIVPILVVPTKEARKLERKLKSLYAPYNVGDNWFELEETRITELRQLQIVVDKAIGKTVKPGFKLEPEDIKQAQRLSELLSNVSKGKTLHKVKFSNGKPVDDLELKSLPPVNYRSLPKLKGKSGYLLVTRDVANYRHRIESAKDPVQYIGKTLGLVSPSFGLEIILVLESDRVKQVEDSLALLYPADENGWRRLSIPQLQEIRNLAKSVPVYKTRYLTPRTHWGIQTCPIRHHKNLPILKDPKGYVCVVQGARRGNRYKFWRMQNLKASGGLFGLAGQLNNPHDALHASKPIRFLCIIRAEHAKAFEAFLKERFSKYKSKKDIFKLDDWYKLSEVQLQEIKDLAK